MADLAGQRGNPVEIAWMVCERCGALGPRTQHSRGSRGLQALCCRVLVYEAAAYRPFAGFLKAMEVCHPIRGNYAER